MFIATAFVAVAAWAARYGATMPDVLCLLAVPVLLGAAVGTLAGRFAFWVLCGVGVDIVLMGLAFVPMIKPVGALFLVAVVIMAARDLWRLRRGE